MSCRIHRAARTAFLAAALVVVLVPCAGASSIAYTRDGNVWLANPDGAGAWQVTLDGTAADPYRHPTQADSGLIVAARGGNLVVLQQNGAVARTIPTTFGDENSAVSPDGTRIAHDGLRNACGTAPAIACVTTVLRLVDGTETGFLLGGSTQPSWVNGSERVVMTSASTVYLGSSNAKGCWFDISYQSQGSAFFPTASDAEVAGDRVAVLADGQQILLGIETPPAAPGAQCGSHRSTVPCELSQPTGQFSSPTWSPDGQSIAWAENDGIWVWDVGATLATDCGQAPAPALRIPGASSPDWGPAAISPGARPQPPVPPVVPPAPPVVPPSPPVPPGPFVPTADVVAPSLVRTAMTVTPKGKRTLTVVTNEAARLTGVLERRVHGVFRRVRSVAGPAALKTAIPVLLGKLKAGTYRLRYRLTDAAGNRGPELRRSFVVPVRRR